MRSLTSIALVTLMALVAVAAPSASASAGADKFPANNVPLLAATKTYMLGDSKFFASSSVTLALQQANNYVCLGNNEVQGFQKMTGAQTQSLPSWQWNASWPLKNGVSAIADVGIAGQFYFSGDPVDGAAPFGMADSATGKVVWTQWVEGAQQSPIYSIFNSTHLFANVYETQKGNSARLYSTINLMTKGYIRNLTEIPLSVTPSGSGVINSWGSTNVAYVTGSGVGTANNGAVQYNLYSWSASPSMGVGPQMLNSTNVIKMTLSFVSPASSSTLYMVNGNQVTPVTLSGLSKGTAITVATGASMWTTPFEVKTVNSAVNVYSLSSQRLTSATIGSTTITQNWRVGNSLNMLGTSVLGNGVVSGTVSSAFFVNPAGSMIYKLQWNTATSPTVYSLPQANLPGNKLAQGSCLSASGSSQWVCKTVAGGSEYPLVVTVQVTNVATTAGSNSQQQQWPKQTGVYQPLWGTFVLEMQSGSSMPMVAEGGMISEVNLLTQDQYDPVTKSPTASVVAGSTIVWYNSSTVWGWSMATKRISLISNIWLADNYTITGILGQDATTIYVQATRSGSTISGGPSEDITNHPANTRIICRLPVSTSATWTNTFGGPSSTDCFRVDNFATCGTKAQVASGTTTSISKATVIDGSLWFLINGKCLVKLTSSGVPSGLLLANYYQKASTVTTTTMSTDVCNYDDSDCKQFWTYGTVKNFQLMNIGGTPSILVTLSRTSGLFYTEQAVQVAASSMTPNAVYRGPAPTKYTNAEDGWTYWQLAGPSYYQSGSGPGSSTGGYTSNFAAIAQLEHTDQYIDTDLLWYQGYWYMGVTGSGKAKLMCYDTATSYREDVWKVSMQYSTSTSGIYGFQSLVYLEGGDSIASFVPQQPGSQIGIRTWEGPSDHNLVNYGMDGSTVLTNSKYVSSFSFLGKGNWESPVCFDGSRTSSSGGTVDGASGSKPSIVGSTVFVTCKSTSTSRVVAALNLYGGDVVQRWNRGKGITASMLGSYGEGGKLYHYYFVTVGGNHTFTRIAAPLNANKGAMKVQYDPELWPAAMTPTVPISGLGIENWNASWFGMAVSMTDTGFGNVYACGSVDSSSENWENAGTWVAALSGYSGMLLWKMKVDTCESIKSLGPVLMIRSNVTSGSQPSGMSLKAVNAMTGRALYDWKPLSSGWNTVMYCNDATIFYTSDTKMWYFSVSSGQQYVVLNLGDTISYDDQTLQSVYGTAAATSAIVVTTKDYAFWVTAFGEVRAFSITQKQAYGENSAVSIKPSGDYAVVVRSGAWKNDFPMFPTTNGQVQNSTVAVLLKWAGTEMPWTKSIVPNQYARARYQTIQNGSSFTSTEQYYAVDWGMVGSTPVALFIESRWIQAMYVTGASAGLSAYGSGVQFWWHKLSPLAKVTNNRWFLTDERANFHSFDVNTGKFNSSFQLQAPKTETYPNIYRPSQATLQGVGMTSTAIFVGFTVLDSELDATSNNNMVIYRIDLDTIGSQTPTDAFASVYTTAAPVKKIGAVMDSNGAETIVVVSAYQAAAVNFKRGAQIIAYPKQSNIIAWNYNKDLSKFYTGTSDTYAQGVSKDAKTGDGKFDWNVTLNSAAFPTMMAGKTYGVKGYLSNDQSKYILTTNNASVCVFNAATGAGYFGATKNTCVDLRTRASAIGKQCTFTNQETSMGSFFAESGGYLYFSSSSSNCIFQINLNTPKVTAVKFMYSYSHAPISVNGNLVFSDGVYVYRLAASQFTEEVGTKVAASILVTGASMPFTYGGYVYVGNTEGLVCINPGGQMSIAWTYKTAGRVVRAPVQIGGNILVGDSTGYIYAVKTNGKLAWTVVAGNPNSGTTNTVLSTLASTATNSFLWITDNGIVAYDNQGKVIWSDFDTRDQRYYKDRYSFGVGRIFPIALNCAFTLTNDMVTLYAKCGAMLVARDIKSGQILYETGMPGDQFAIVKTTMTYPGNTKIVEQNVQLPATATFPPGYVPPTPAPTINWGYAIVLNSQKYIENTFTRALAMAVGINDEDIKDTIKVLSVNRQQQGLAVVQVQFMGKKATEYTNTMNFLSSNDLQNAGILSFSAIDTADTIPPKVVVNVKKNQGAVVVFLVLIFLITIVAVIVLVVMMTKLGGGANKVEASRGGHDNLDQGLVANNAHNERGGDI